ncbi:MAG: HRDC domain-containing protein [Bergeyella sp.]
MKTKIFKIRISEDYLHSDQKRLDEFLSAHTILKFESAFVQEKENFWSVILYYESQESSSRVREVKSGKYSVENGGDLNSDEIKILDSLKLWRAEKAKEQNLPSYFIATNNELMSVAKFKPVKKEELQEIKGFGKHKIENYGEEIIEIVENV